MYLARSEKVYTVILDCKAVNEKEAYLEPTVQASGLLLSDSDAERAIEACITAEDDQRTASIRF